MLAGPHTLLSYALPSPFLLAQADALPIKQPGGHAFMAI